MKMFWRCILATLLVAPGVYADFSEKEIELDARLSETIAPELPSVVLDLVRAADEEEQAETIDAAIQIVALRRPAALPLVVSTLSKAEPQLSVLVVSAAVQASPAQAQLIERAAQTAAPAYAASISAVVKAQDHKPKHTRERGNRGGGEGESNGLSKRPDPRKFFLPPGHGGTTLPNGKELPDPPRRPVDPPRPIHYNKPPKPDRPKPEHPLPERPGNPNPGGKPVRPSPPGGHPVWDR